MSLRANSCWQTSIATTLLALLAGALVAQEPVPGEPPTPDGPPAAAAPGAAGRTPQDPAVAAAAAVATARMNQWKQLKFDRRPSTILQAWAAPELKPYDPSEEKDAAANNAPAAAGAPAPTPDAEGQPEELEIVDLGGMPLVVRLGTGQPMPLLPSTPSPAACRSRRR